MICRPRGWRTDILGPSSCFPVYILARVRREVANRMRLSPNTHGTDKRHVCRTRTQDDQVVGQAVRHELIFPRRRPLCPCGGLGGCHDPRKKHLCVHSTPVGLRGACCQPQNGHYNSPAWPLSRDSPRSAHLLSNLTSADQREIPVPEIESFLFSFLNSLACFWPIRSLSAFA